MWPAAVEKSVHVTKKKNVPSSAHQCCHALLTINRRVGSERVNTMPRDGIAMDHRVIRAAELLLKAPALTTSQAMRAVDCFSEAKVANTNRRRQVQRARDKLAKQDEKPTTATKESAQEPPSIIQDSGTSVTSTLTTASSAFKYPKASSQNAKTQFKYRRTSAQTQIDRVNTKWNKDIHKEAHKTATSRYHEEKQKAHGLSALAICKEVDEEYGTDLNDRTIRNYALKLLLV